MADDWHAPIQRAVNYVVTAPNWNEDQDNFDAIYSAMVGDAQATSEVIHRHKVGTRAARPAAGSAGRLYYATDLGDGGVTFLDDGAAWHGVSPLIARKPDDEIVNNSQAIQSDDDLVFAVGANETWIFEMFLSYFTSTVADIKFEIVVPGGATLRWGTSEFINGLSGTPVYTVITTGEHGVEGLGGNNAVHVMGTVENGATPGDVQLRWAQWHAEVSNTIVHENSWLKANMV